ncbi:hypothetical protein C8R47DRAFT_1204238 [Mycena vitilis]|nr:hypothetical protein C8R47DRAFT_1204238 [Mycena vitilis]
MNPDSLPRKCGRPLGSKDGPCKEGARPRGRLKKTIPESTSDAADDADNEETDTETANAAGLISTIHEPDFDASFDAFDARYFSFGPTQFLWPSGSSWVHRSQQTTLPCTVLARPERVPLESQPPAISDTEIPPFQELDVELENSPQQPPDVLSEHPGDNTTVEGKSKRQRILTATKRKNPNVRTCRRCKTICPGNSDILSCPVKCTVPCVWCGNFTGCRGVDRGAKCTFQGK